MTGLKPLPNADDLVHGFWPTDGTAYTPDRLAAALDTAGEIIRYANHATFPGNGASTLPYAPDLDRAIVAVEALTQRLPQLLGQLADRAAELVVDPTLRHDQHGDNPRPAADAADATALYLNVARPAADRLQALVHGARERSARLLHRMPVDGA